MLRRTFPPEKYPPAQEGEPILVSTFGRLFSFESIEAYEHADMEKLLGAHNVTPLHVMFIAVDRRVCSSQAEFRAAGRRRAFPIVCYRISP